MPCCFLEACGDASELLELGEAAFDEVALGVEVLVDPVFAGSGGIVRDDCYGPLFGNRFSQAVAVVGGIGQHDFCRQALDQGIGLRRVALLAGGEREADRASKPAHGHVDLGAQATTRAAKGLIFSPLFAPEAC